MSNLFAGAPLPGRFDRVQKADLSQATTTFRAMDIRDKEAARRFERAEDMRREDLDKVAGFDISGLGQMGSELFKVDADALAEQIKNGELDPTEARAAITKLTGDYRQYKAHGDAMAERSEYAKSVATDPKARQAHNDGLSVGYQTTYGVDDYGLQKNASMNQLFVPGSAKKGDDGRWTVVDPNTNQRVPITQVTGYADPNHFYRFGEEKVDVGDLQTTAMSESVQNRILKRGNNVFYEKNAIMEYDTLTENSNRSGQGLRLQILEDYQDESGNSTYFNESDEQRAFQFGPNGYNRIEGIRDEDEKIKLQQAWLSVWGPPAQERKKDDSGNIIAEGSGWDLLNSERPKFVEYARFAMDSAEIERRKRIASGNKQEVSRYAVGSLAVNTEQRAQDALAIGLGANEQAPGYQMIAVVDKEGSSDPIQIEGSDLGISEGGKYLIQGFGVDPLYGINKDGTNSSTGRRDDGQQMASVTVKTERNQYKPFGGGEAISQEDYDQLSANDRALYEQSVVKEETQKRIPIGPGTSPEGEAIFNRLMRDPEAAALMKAEITKARKERGLYLYSLGEVKGRQEAEEQELQDQANERALANEQREQERQDQIRLDLANARRADERAEIIKGDSFKEENVVSQVGGRNVYDPPFMNAEIRDGKWFTSEGGDNPIGRVVIYQDENGKSQKGMAPLRG